MTDSFRPAGYTSLTPFLCVSDGNAAIDFYTDVFGATLISKMDTPTGGVAHAELEFDQGRLQLSDALPDFNLAPPAGGPADHSIGLYCADVDAVVELAAKRGATVREPASTFVTGDRFASILDPFGHRWTVMTRVEDLTPEEVDRRLADWGAKEFSS